MLRIYHKNCVTGRTQHFVTVVYILCLLDSVCIEFGKTLYNVMTCHWCVYGDLWNKTRLRPTKTAVLNFLMWITWASLFRPHAVMAQLYRCLLSMHYKVTGSMRSCFVCGKDANVLFYTQTYVGKWSLLGKTNKWMWREAIASQAGSGTDQQVDVGGGRISSRIWCRSPDFGWVHYELWFWG